ncbi:MAG: aminotransferase class I/II-fold pyridoxal phosphate-dependent enzyme [Candidatus Borkfalkiaceae bacterium]|nr:aminotransferase class I/II-fold pyridoxal phosphate-dependent enzyme [Christensenellaceae bacterium]
MNTPIRDFIKANRKKEHRFYMPGHKGRGYIARDDVTEIEGADVLYRPEGIIAESEKNAARIFGAARTVFSCEGSSLGIRALVYLLKTYALRTGKNPLILAARNVHSSFVSACGLNGVSPEWLYGEGGNLLSVRLTAESVDQALSRTGAFAVFITSPDYLGHLCDISALSEVCKKHGALLAVDNAHGSYLRFTDPCLHPVALGADLCVESAHKTLPCLTGTAYLHVAPSAPAFFAENADFACYLFASTSPSYLLLASLDDFNGKAKTYAEGVKRTAERVGRLRASLADAGYGLYGEEPLKLTLRPASYGYTGNEIADLLRGKGIEAEYADRDFIVLLVSPCNREESLAEAEKTLLGLKKRTAAGKESVPSPVVCGKAAEIRDALYAPWEEIPTEEAEGRVLSGLVLSCPPAVPVAVCGERLNADAVSALLYYGYRTVKVML